MIGRGMRIRRLVTRIDKIDDSELLQLKKRVDIATLFIIVMIALLIARLWYLQIHKGEEYSHLAEDNRVRVQNIAAPRGVVWDRDGRVIVGNRPSFNVVWMKEDSPDPEEVLRELSRILDIDISILLGRVRTGSRLPPYVPVPLAEDISWQALVYIENHRFQLPGIRIEVMPTREYLSDEFASHLIGYLGEISKKELQSENYVGYQGGDLVGKTGIEKRHEELLHGEKGKNYLEVDVRGVEQKQLKVHEPLPGNDLYLTVDIELQIAAEKAMIGLSGAVVAMEVNTGRMLTMMSSPALQLSKWVGGISQTNWRRLLSDPLKPLINKPIQGLYAPGSTYKIITAQAALSEGIVNSETVLYCAGSYKFGNRRYGCWKRSGHGAVNLHKALAESCDIYFYIAGQRLGVDKLAQYSNSFGLGYLTEIDLENEKAGLVPTSEWKIRVKKEPWQEGETLSVAIGQGFNTTTPLQICQMTAALANGGTLYRPQYVEAARDADGKKMRVLTPQIDGKVKGSTRNLRLVRKALVAAVNDKHGTGRKAALEDVVVAGKTGTAQVVRLKHFRHLPEDQIPYKYRDHAWFTCFAPAEKPVIAVTVLVEHGGHGGSVAGPVAKAVMEAYFKKQGKGKSEK